MELLQLRYFLTVARLLNISRAAQYHRVPQPAMSKTISKLEKELGTALFDRYKNKLTLTQAGQEFFRSVTASIGGIDNAVEALGGTQTPLRGELKLLVQQHRGTVVDTIMGFKQLYPGVAFQIVYEPEAVDYHDFDLCISSTAPDETFDSSIRLITERLKLVVSATHRAAAGTAVRFADLKDESFAVISKKSNLWQQTLLQCREAGFEPRVSMICGDLYCLIKYVGAGIAVTLGPEVSWQGLKDDSVVFLPTQPELSRSTYVFWNGSRTPTRLCSAYRDYLVDYFANHLAKGGGGNV